MAMAGLGTEELRRLRRLHQAGGRRDQGRFLVEGRRAIDGFLEAGWRPEGLWSRVGQAAPATWPVALLGCLPAKQMDRLSQVSSSPGLLAEFAIPAAVPPDPARGGLILAGVGDPGNVGTLLRGAAAFGYGQVVLLGGADPWSAKVVQASAGALARLALSCSEDLPATLREGAPLVALCAEGGEGPGAFEPGPCWLVIGSEAHGVPGRILDHCQRRLCLPMPGGTESLNAAMAGSIAAFLLAGLHRAGP